MSRSQAGEELVKFSPGEYIEFTHGLNGGFEPSKIVLENVAAVTVVFKVKTTQPQRYLVKPNQGLIEPGERATVTINIHHREWNPKDENKGFGDKFKVETARYTKYNPKDTKENMEKDIANIFKPANSSPDNPVSARKLKCKFVDAPISSNANLNTPTKILEEFKDLRMKYDKVVEYTVKLTGERDDLQKQIKEEKGKNQMLAAKVGKLGASTETDVVVGAETAVSVGGISLFYAVLIALVCFLLGRVVN